MSFTQKEKYSDGGYILKNPPGRLLIVTYWTALGVWLTPGGRQFEPTKSLFGHADIHLFSLFFENFVTNGYETAGGGSCFSPPNFLRVVWPYIQTLFRAICVYLN